MSLPNEPAPPREKASDNENKEPKKCQKSGRPTSLRENTAWMGIILTHEEPRALPTGYEGSGAHCERGEGRTRVEGRAVSEGREG